MKCSHYCRQVFRGTAVTGTPPGGCAGAAVCRAAWLTGEPDAEEQKKLKDW